MKKIKQTKYLLPVGVFLMIVGISDILDETYFKGIGFSFFAILSFILWKYSSKISNTDSNKE